MENLSRRRVLTLGAALGIVSAVDVPSAWAWSSRGSIAEVNQVTDPWKVWDDATDPLVASLLDNGQVPAVNKGFASWVKNSDPLPAEFPAPLVTYLQQNNKLPSWADAQKLARATELHKRLNLYLFLLYGLGSGIMSTVIPREARNVYYSAGGADMKSRAAKTFTYGYDQIAPTAFLPAGNFITTSNKTRLTHAAVRHLLPKSAAWKAVTDDQDFIPISNGDILVTFHSLGTYVYGKLRDWGIKLSAAEEDAFLHQWQVSLHLLGVRDDFIPKSWAAAREQSAYALTPIMGPTREGIDLANILLGLTAQVDLGVTRGFLNEFVRYMLSDKVGDWLKLPPDPAARALVRVAWPAFVRFREGLSPIMPEGFGMLDKFVRALGMLFLSNGTSASYTPITIPTGNRP